MDVTPQEISIEDSKLHLDQAAKLGNLFPLRHALHAAEVRRDLSEAAKRMSLQAVLRSAFKGKTSTGDSVGDLLKLVQQSKVFDHLSYLNDERLLNEVNSALDFGEKPVLVGKKGPVKNPNAFAVPKSSRSRVVVEYAECRPNYCIEGSYRASGLYDQGVTQDEFEETVQNANEIVLPFRGKAVRWELCYWIALFVGLAVFFTVAMVLGALVSYIITAVVCAAFVGLAIAGFIWVRRRNGRLLLYAHLVLALFLRCENNRLYLRHKILVRPGYLAKWMEFNMLPSQQSSGELR